jgi:hypothetical protein
MRGKRSAYGRAVGKKQPSTLLPNGTYRTYGSVPISPISHIGPIHPQRTAHAETRGANRPCTLAPPPSGGKRWDRLGNLSVTANQWQGEARVPCERFLEDPEPRPTNLGRFAAYAGFARTFRTSAACLSVLAFVSNQINLPSLNR